MITKIYIKKYKNKNLRKMNLKKNTKNFNIIISNYEIEINRMREDIENFKIFENKILSEKNFIDNENFNLINLIENLKEKNKKVFNFLLFLLNFF